MVTAVFMVPPVHLGSKTSQEADDNHTTVLGFGGVQGCHKTQSLNPSFFLIYACSTWVLKPSTSSAYLPSHYMYPTLHLSIGNFAFFQLKSTLKPVCSGSPEIICFHSTQTRTQTRVSRVSRGFQKNFSV